MFYLSFLHFNDNRGEIKAVRIQKLTISSAVLAAELNAHYFKLSK